MTSAAGGRRGAGRPGCNRHVRARGGGGGSGMRGAELEARVGGPGRLRHGRYQVAVAGGGTSVIPACLELPRSCHSPGGRGAGGRAGEPSRTRLTARQPPGWPLAAEPTRGWPSATHGLAAEDAERQAADGPRVRARAGEEKTQAGQGLWRGGQRAPSCDCSCCHGNRETGCGGLRVRRAARVPPEARSPASASR